MLNLALGDWLDTHVAVLRTFVLATVAVPIVIYGLMPQLHLGCGSASHPPAAAGAA